jgi:hypothetical protein
MLAEDTHVEPRESEEPATRDSSSLRRSIPAPFE